MKVNGDRQLAAWTQFGMQETRRIIKKFPSIHSYIVKMTDPNQPDDPDREIENSITRYRIRFLNNLRTTTPNMAIRREYQRLYLNQPRCAETVQSPEEIIETGHNRRRNLDLDPIKIDLINRQTGFLSNTP